MNKETTLSQDNKEKIDTAQGGFYAWDKLKEVPFAGAIGKKIDKIYAEHEVARGDYNGGGNSFYGYGEKVNESADLNTEVELQEEIQAKRVKKIGRMILDLPGVRHALSKQLQRSIKTRDKERERAVVSLENKKQEAEMKVREREEIEKKLREEEEKTKWIEENKKDVDDAIREYGIIDEKKYLPHSQKTQEEKFSKKTNDLIEKKILSEDEQFIAAAEIARKRSEARNIAEQRYARRREKIERMLNSGLTTVDELREAVLTGEHNATKTEIEYDGKQIEIIDSGDMDMKYLQHQLDFDGKNPELRQKIEKHPEIWNENMKNIDENLSSELCLQYVDEKINPVRINGLCYGFSRVRPISLKYFGVGNAVGGGYKKVRERMQMSDRDTMIYPVDTTGTQDINSLDDVARGTVNGQIHLNEFVFDRYNEKGEQEKPDYIISDGKISEAMKKHAAYFDIPIVIVHDRTT